MLPHCTNIHFSLKHFFSNVKSYMQLCPIQGDNIIICKGWQAKNSINGPNFSIKSLFGEKTWLSCQNLILTTHLPSPSYHKKALRCAQEHLEGCSNKHSWFVLLSVAVQSHTGPSLTGERHMEACTNTVHTFSRIHLSLLQICNKVIKWLQGQTLAHVKYALDCVVKIYQLSKFGWKRTIFLITCLSGMDKLSRFRGNAI